MSTTLYPWKFLKSCKYVRGEKLRELWAGWETDRSDVYYTKNWGDRLRWEEMWGALQPSWELPALWRSVYVLILSCHGVLTHLSDETEWYPTFTPLLKTNPFSKRFMISTYLSCQSSNSFLWTILEAAYFSEIIRLLQNLSLRFSSDISLECVSVPSAKPQWIQAMKDTALAIEERLYWECRANGKPKPSYTWLKNGQQLLSEVNYCLSSATYQCFILKT